ncbi:pre-rRNA-processing protein TSR2 homolog isoform X2 [Sinocyclocheilus anshuiensis]|uniref:pre-rRNA-processing protein TSR2 homolog isoform X2 n=1 Tax=Sinocyclocheilus anshuiensis TaxID=1608454 RepID=UPI0007B87592|nr:PREDICTED: pre-rRNA-processing protein TSR2 homolog isoform X2 [Sinocyclocheilus anshuiensis]
MAPLASSTRELFTEAVRAVLETWPVLQIAVDNDFSGTYSQQKAEWMVDALRLYFIDNDELQQDEVEDFISDLMNNEFDTVVDDGSLPQVAQQVCEMFQQCQQDRLTEVREQIKQLIQKKSAGRAKATPAKTPAAAADDDDDESQDEAMECDGGADGASVNGAAVKEQHLPPQAASHEEEDDGWTVVRRKK